MYISSIEMKCQVQLPALAHDHLASTRLSKYFSADFQLDLVPKIVIRMIIIFRTKISYQKLVYRTVEYLSVVRANLNNAQ